MTRWLPAAAVALALILPGCMAGEKPGATTPPPSAAAGEVLQFEDVPAAVFGALAGPDLNASLAAPPRLVPGEWWRITYTSDFFASETTVVRVVAAVGHEGYAIGMPHEAWQKEAISFHAPAFGDIGTDLSYATHNERFEPVRFPLEQGKTWKTSFSTVELVATVESTDEFTATVRFDEAPAEPGLTAPIWGLLGLGGSDGPAVRLVYDARQHEVVSFESFLGTWEVVAHGYGFEGWVTIPRGEHTAIDYGRSLFAAQEPPTQTLDINGGFNRLTLMHIIEPQAPGVYRVRAAAPNGSEFVTEARGPAGHTVQFFEAADPDGTWTLEDVVGGMGSTYSMGIAYHQYDIHLPDGGRRGDHSHDVTR